MYCFALEVSDFEICLGFPLFLFLEKKKVIIEFCCALFYAHWELYSSPFYLIVCDMFYGARIDHQYPVNYICVDIEWFSAAIYRIVSPMLHFFLYCFCFFIISGYHVDTSCYVQFYSVVSYIICTVWTWIKSDFLLLLFSTIIA